MDYKSYMCGSCKYKDVNLTEPEDWPVFSVPICKFCNDGSKYEPKAAKPPINPVTINTGEFTKALKKISNSVFTLDPPYAGTSRSNTILSLSFL